jgi:gliding motility-associated-like protein
MVRGVRCFGDVNGLIAIDSILVGEFPIMFSIDGAPFRDQKAFGPLVPGPHTVTLLDANGCEWTSDTLWVQQPPDFIAELGPDVEVHLGDSVTLGVDISYPPVALKNIVWKPLLDTLFAGKTTQHFLPLNSLKVMVEVTDTAGCKASDGVQVRVSRDRRIFIPNIIAPQSSENNIALIYGGDDVVEIESFQIFDRWGDLIFSRQHVQPNDKQQGWNGTTNGQDVQPGVYVYQAQIRFADGQSEAFFGSVTVVR